ncbi:hypothetical protein BU26DRAFT_523796 [Trematosphaeria pertusa]|uniref:Uncharacterized protein n=1 Tax=Trematosphaeria pertusa TaxID=390896 RepID=A0A6A6HZP9_9PLEO|nr:uncharacterized protein BU26DRAFT_523796 [Trematosphaeria pertusa]KAF2243506.1 hypothetical protein BU26DRAFT_523796 [Trematosphaeria pertusa]
MEAFLRQYPEFANGPITNPPPSAMQTASIPVWQSATTSLSRFSPPSVPFIAGILLISLLLCIITYMASLLVVEHELGGYGLLTVTTAVRWRELTTRLKRARAQVASLKRQTEWLGSQLRTEMGKKAQALLELENTRRDLQAGTDHNKENAGENRATNDTIEALKKELEETKTELRDSRQHGKILEDDLQRMEANMQVDRDTIKELRRQLSVHGKQE